MHFRFRALVTLLLLFALREAAPAAPGRPFRFDELALRSVPRRWLQLIGRAASASQSG